MGGRGSGRRWHVDPKDTTDNYRSIDVRRWNRDGLLKPPQSFSWAWSRRGEKVASIGVRTETDRVILIYRHRRRGEDWKDENCAVSLDWTACHLGGQRPWFLCPDCGRRVAILYMGAIPTCRHCFRLAFPCQREPKNERAARRADKIRERLGWGPGFIGIKPKGMHWRTFERLTAEYDAFMQEAWEGMI